LHSVTQKPLERLYATLMFAIDSSLGYVDLKVVSVVDL